MHDIRELITKTWGAEVFIDVKHNKGTHYNVDMTFSTERYRYHLSSDRGVFRLVKFDKDLLNKLCEHTCKGATNMYRFMKYINNY